VFEAIKYRWDLHKLEKESDKIQDDYEKLRKKKKLSGTELEDLRSEESSVIWPVLEKIDKLKTLRFCQIANRLIVPLPESNDKELWKELHCIGGQALTDKGFWELKKLIRQEKKERREVFGFWFGIITGGVIGVIGAITGLVAVLAR